MFVWKDEKEAEDGPFKKTRPDALKKNILVCLKPTLFITFLMFLTYYLILILLIKFTPTKFRACYYLFSRILLLMILRWNAGLSWFLNSLSECLKLAQKLLERITQVQLHAKQSEQKYQFWTFNQFLSVIYERFYATGNL